MSYVAPPVFGGFVLSEVGESKGGVSNDEVLLLWKAYYSAVENTRLCGSDAQLCGRGFEVGRKVVRGLLGDVSKSWRACGCRLVDGLDVSFDGGIGECFSVGGSGSGSSACGVDSSGGQAARGVDETVGVNAMNNGVGEENAIGSGGGCLDSRSETVEDAVVGNAELRDSVVGVDGDGVSSLNGFEKYKIADANKKKKSKSACNRGSF